MCAKIKVVLVDDHSLMREALAVAIGASEEIEIVGSFSSGEEVVLALQEITPDVVVMDILMKGVNGIEATKLIKEKNPTVKVILLSSEVRKEFVSEGIQAGISGYLPKDSEREALIDAIKAASKDDRYFNEAITAMVFEDFYKKASGQQALGTIARNSDLTRRELEILGLIANGKSNKELAETLFISIRTVETHKSKILRKLGLRNTAELITYSVKNGLVSM